LLPVDKIDEHVSCKGKKALVSDAPGSSSTPPRNHRRGFAKNKAAWIMSAAPGAIFPCMRRSFVDRQYSPLTNMDLSEWEIILDICMGYIVMKEPDNDGNE
jgi:hypothetical protein